MTVRRAVAAEDGGSEEGGAAIEVVILATLLLTILLFFAGLDRISSAEGQAQAAAADAAQAVAVQTGVTQQSADATALAAASATLANQGITCPSTKLVVTADLTNYKPGGFVSVKVSCDTNLSNVVFAGFPGHKVIAASAAAPVDQYRGL